MSNAMSNEKSIEPTPVSIDRQSDIDEKEQVDHVEASAQPADPKAAALQEGMEALQRLSQDEYDALHKRLVRKVGNGLARRLRPQLTPSIDRHSTFARLVRPIGTELSRSKRSGVSVLLLYRQA